MSFPNTAAGVAQAAFNMIESYKVALQRKLDREQLDAHVTEQMTRVVASMEADQATLAAVTE